MSAITKLSVSTAKQGSFLHLYRISNQHMVHTNFRTSHHNLLLLPPPFLHAEFSEPSLDIEPSFVNLLFNVWGKFNSSIRETTKLRKEIIVTFFPAVEC